MKDDDTKPFGLNEDLANEGGQSPDADTHTEENEQPANIRSSEVAQEIENQHHPRG